MKRYTIFFNEKVNKEIWSHIFYLISLNQLINSAKMTVEYILYVNNIFNKITSIMNTSKNEYLPL